MTDRTGYTAMIWPEEGGGVWRNVVAVHDDETGSAAAGIFEIPPFARPERARGEVCDPWEPLESAAERVLAENGWQVTGTWNCAGSVDVAPAERI